MHAPRMTLEESRALITASSQDVTMFNYDHVPHEHNLLDVSRPISGLSTSKIWTTHPYFDLGGISRKPHQVHICLHTTTIHADLSTASTDFGRTRPPVVY